MTTAKQYKQKMLKDAFNNRLTIPKDGLIAHEQACSDCQEQLVFALDIGDQTVSIGLTTVLKLLRVAELEGFVPKIDEGREFGEAPSWWGRV